MKSMQLEHPGHKSIDISSVKNGANLIQSEANQNEKQLLKFEKK